MSRKQLLRSAIILFVTGLAIPVVGSSAEPVGSSSDNRPLPVASDTWSRSFECHTKDLNSYYPPNRDKGKDTIMVREITDRLGVPPIKVYDIPGLKDAFAVKPIPGTMPVFKENPEFEGIIIDSNNMNINVDVSPEAIKTHRHWGKTGGLVGVDETNVESSVEQFIKQGRERRMGILAHEVAHMLLPADLRGFIGNNTEKKDIQVQNVRVKKMLENLHDAISEKKLNLSSDANWQFANEVAADYVAGGILAYMGVGEAGVKYMLKMHDLSGDRGNATHLRGNKRLEVVNMGYEAHSVE